MSARTTEPVQPESRLEPAGGRCLSPRNRYQRFNRSFPLPLEGVPASLSPGLRTASGAKRNLGAKLPSAICAMTGESTNSKKMLLAIAVAEGTSVEEWALTNGVPERTAYY